MQMSDIMKLRRSADGFIDFEIEFGKYLLNISGSESAELFVAGALLCRELRFGRVGLELKKWAGRRFPAESGQYVILPQYDEWLKILMEAEKSDVVCFEDAVECKTHTPLVLSESGRLTLRRYWKYEKIVSEKLLCLREFSAVPQLYSDADSCGKTPDLQDLAVFAGMNSRLLILSGGPGTGKTTVAGRMLTEIFRKNIDCKVVCAAPTGKAQQRLVAQLRENAEKLPDNDPVKEKLQTLPGSTIHALLYRKSMQVLLSCCDLLLLDECSMVSLPLFADLLERLPENASLILIGDRRQLTPVGSGSVLADICSGSTANVLPVCGAEVFNSAGGNVAAADDGIFSGYLVELLKNYRSASAPNICLAADKLRDLLPEQADAAAEFICELSGEDFICRQVAPEKYREELKKRLYEKLTGDYTFADIVELCSSGRKEDLNTALQMIDKFKILCAVNEMQWGVKEINKAVLELLDITPDVPGKWKPGTILLINENDRRTGLQNGDCGVVFRTPDGEKAMFANHGDVEFALPELPKNSCGFALSIHKAQGSGIDNVLLIMPEKSSEILSRELLYTAITRAAKHIEIWSGKRVLSECIAKPAERASGMFLQ